MVTGLLPISRDAWPSSQTGCTARTLIAPAIPSLPLADLAPESRTLAEAGGLDGGAADAAGLILAIVDVEGLLEVAGGAAFVDEVAQRGATLFESGGQHFADGGGQAAVAGEREPSGGALGRDTGAEQRFAGVDVADADDDVAVHDEGFDGGGAAPGTGMEVFAGKALFEGFRAERREKRVLARIFSSPKQAAKAAGVVIAEAEAAGEDEVVMIVLAGRAGGGSDAETPGHAEMDEQRARPGPEQQVFAAPGETLQRLPGQEVRQCGRNGPAEPGFPDEQPLDGLPFQVRTDATQGGFDFGEFRHG